MVCVELVLTVLVIPTNDRGVLGFCIAALSSSVSLALISAFAYGVHKA